MSTHKRGTRRHAGEPQSYRHNATTQRTSRQQSRKGNTSTGRTAYAWQPSLREHMEPGAVYMVSLVMRWYTLPAGLCGHCGRETSGPRTLAAALSAIPTRYPRHGDPQDEALSDERFCRLAREQARGHYDIGALAAICPRCAAEVLAPLPDGMGAMIGTLRRALPAPMTDIVIGHAKPGPNELAGTVLISGRIGRVIPDLEARLERMAAAELNVTPRVIYAREVLP